MLGRPSASLRQQSERRPKTTRETPHSRFYAASLLLTKYKARYAPRGSAFTVLDRPPCGIFAMSLSNPGNLPPNTDVLSSAIPTAVRMARRPLVPISVIRNRVRVRSGQRAVMNKKKKRQEDKKQRK
jgi:hypothetical protein